MPHPTIRRLSALALLAMLAGCIIIPIEVTTTKTAKSPALAAGPARLPAGCTRPPEADVMQKEVLAGVNALRKAEGLPAVRASSRLAIIAQAHACDNAARASISHVSADGSTLADRMRKGGYRLRTAAENTGLGFGSSSDRMVAFWTGSPYHRANMLNPDVTEAGLGYAPGGKPAWILNLAKPR